MERIVVELCTGTSCHLMGGMDLLAAIQDLLGQGQVELRYATCLGVCGRGPNVRIDGVLYQNLTPGGLKFELRRLLEDRKKGMEYER